jgi:hypothetical protein
MNTKLLPHERLSLHAHAALIDTAKQRAVELRRGAIDLFAARVARLLGLPWRALRRRSAASRRTFSIEA